MIKIYHNPRCSKSRGVLQLLERINKPFKIISYTKDGITVEELTALVKKIGISPKELIRKNEKVFIQQFKDKLLDDIQWIEVMVNNYSLIERPILETENNAVIGRPDGAVTEFLKSVNYL